MKLKRGNGAPVDSHDRAKVGELIKAFGNDHELLRDVTRRAMIGILGARVLEAPPDTRDQMDLLFHAQLLEALKLWDAHHRMRGGPARNATSLREYVELTYAARSKPKKLRRKPPPKHGYTADEQHELLSSLMDRVCEAMQTTREQLSGNSKSAHVVLARRVYTLLAREYTGFNPSFGQIAKVFGPQARRTRTQQRYYDAKRDQIATGVAQELLAKWSGQSERKEMVA